MHLLYDTFRHGKPKDLVHKQIVQDFESIETIKSTKSKVAIFGDLYVRDNNVMN